MAKQELLAYPIHGTQYYYFTSNPGMPLVEKPVELDDEWQPLLSHEAPCETRGRRYRRNCKAYLRVVKQPIREAATFIKKQYSNCTKPRNSKYLCLECAALKTEPEEEEEEQHQKAWLVEQDVQWWVRKLRRPRATEREAWWVVV